MRPKAEIKHKGPFTLRTITGNSERPKRLAHPPYNHPSFSRPSLTCSQHGEDVCCMLFFHFMLSMLICNCVQSNVLNPTMFFHTSQL
jgi:hypothetical protein